MRNLILITAAIFSLSLSAFGQRDTILTLEGSAIPCVVNDTTGFFVNYSVFKRNGKEKKREVHRSEVFSVIKEDGSEVVYYEPDQFLGEDLSPEEMRIYVAGARDARENYRPIWTVVGGVVFAGVISYLGQGGFILTIAPPIAYMLFQFIPYIKIKEETMSNLSYQYNDLYAAGYESVARGRKVLSGLKGGTLGSILGFLTQIIIPMEN
jgi:hypothetical protein